MVDLSPVVAPETEMSLSKKHARVLRAVSAINAVMFVIEATTGYFAHSMAMMSDSVDMLGDALGAGTGVLVRNSSPRKQAWVALAKAGFSAAMGLGILGGAAFLLFNPVMPVVATMALVGGLAFTANATCAALLYKHRNDNININATWKCTRNDTVSNLGVLSAAALSHFLLTPIPDIVVGAVVSGLFIRSSVSIARDAIRILRTTKKEKKENSGVQAALSGLPKPGRALSFKGILPSVFNRKAVKVIGAANDNAAELKAAVKKVDWQTNPQSGNSALRA